MKMNRLFAGFSMLALSAVMLTDCGGPPPNPVHSVDDLKGKHIGVQLGTTGDTLASDLEDTNVEKYNKAADAVRKMILAGSSAEEIRSAWSEDVEAFKRRRRPYLLYDE